MSKMDIGQVLLKLVQTPRFWKNSEIVNIRNEIQTRKKKDSYFKGVYE